MTNIMIRYDPQLIFEPKITTANADLKLIMSGASFESDPQIHLRILYILYNVTDIKPSTAETSEIIIDFLMNIYNFRYVLTMNEDYDFPIQPYTPSQPREKESAFEMNRMQVEGENLSIHSRPVPLENSNKNLGMSKQRSNSSVVRDTIEEEEDSKIQSEDQESNPFYFENDEFALCKIDGLRMSLCMSIKILSRLSNVNRRANCTQIFNSKFDKFDAMFDYFHPLIRLNTSKCNEYIICVLEIILKGSELGKLEEIILRKDTVKHLIELLKTVLEKELNDMILMILEIFRHLSNEPKFYNYLQIENPMPLLDRASLRENKNEEIKNKANSLFESVIKNDSQKYSYIMQYDSEELKNIRDAPVDKQLSFLKNFEDAMQQNKVKLDQLSDSDLEHLIEVCKFDHYDENMDMEESFNDFADDSKDKKQEVKDDESSEDSPIGNVLHRKILLAVSIMKSLAKSKIDKIKKKITKYVTAQGQIHKKLQKISPKHLYVIFEFYLEYYKTNFETVKDNEVLIESMFDMSKSILAEKELPGKDLKNVIEFCTTIMKANQSQKILEKITGCARQMIKGTGSDDETVRTSISSFIKMIYFNPASIEDICLEFLKDLIFSPEKDVHNLGLFCLFSLSLYTLTIEHLRKLDAVTMLIRKLESGKYEKRVYALKIIINFMEISSLDECLLQENNFSLFSFLLHFTQSELQEEQRLATRGLSKLPLRILQAHNPRVMPLPQEPRVQGPLEILGQNLAEEQDRQTIKEDSSEQSMSDDELDRDNGSESKSETKSEAKSEKEEEKKEESVSHDSKTSETSSDGSSSDKSNIPIGSKGNIHSFLTSLSMKIRPRNNADADIQYFSLYSIFNLLLQTNINNPDKRTDAEESKLESVPMDQKNWNDLSVKEFNKMLIDVNLVNNVIALIVKAKDEDVIRISLKIIILLTFKVPIKEFMNFDTGDKFWLMSCMSNDTENSNYYNFQSFLGYVLHRSKKENIDITSFMSVDAINSFILKLCNDFREDELLELNQKGNNAKKKMIIYKFFFVSYLISLLTKILDQKCSKINIDVRLAIKQL